MVVPPDPATPSVVRSGSSELEAAREEGRAEVLRAFEAEMSKAGGSVSNVGGGLGSFGVASSSRTTAPRKGTAELLQAYADAPWLRAVAHRVGESTAGVGWELWRETRKGKGSVARGIKSIDDPEKRREAKALAIEGGELELVRDHPIYRLLDQANEIHDGLQFRTVTQVQYDVVGEGFGLLELDSAGEPDSIWNVPPIWVREVPRPGAKRVFRVNPSGTAAWAEFPMERMLWMSDLSARDPYGRGTGTARAASDEIDTDEFASKYVKNFFWNDGTPAFVVFGEGLNQSMTEQFEARWMEKVQGFFKARRPLFLNRKVDIHEFANTFEEMQFIELRQFQRDLIFQIFGVPPEILGVLGDSNRATITQADWLYGKMVVDPRANRWRMPLNRRVVALYKDPSLFLDYLSPIPEDLEQKPKTMRDHPYAFSVDEHRAMGYHKPISGGAGRVYPSPEGIYPSARPLEAGAEASRAASAAAAQPKPSAPKPKPAKSGQFISGSALYAAVAPVARKAFYAAFEAESKAAADSPAAEEFLGRVLRARTERAAVGWSSALVAILESDPEDPSHEVNRFFDVLRNARASTMARLETVRSTSFGRLEAYRHLGTDVQKVWLCKEDHKVRATHDPLSGQALGLEERFRSSSGDTALYPGDFGTAAENSGCRCTIGRRVDEKMDHLALWKTLDDARLPFEAEARRAIRRALEEARRSVLGLVRERRR